MICFIGSEIRASGGSAGQATGSGILPRSSLLLLGSPGLALNEIQPLLFDLLPVGHKALVFVSKVKGICRNSRVKGRRMGKPVARQGL